jgi:cytochrome c-type biogenesis protein
MALVFVLGFSTIFVLLGASATFAGHWLLQHAQWLARLAGIMLIILGMHLTGIIQIPFLLLEKRFQMRNRKMSMFSAFLVGAAFAFGWSPCVGPLLAGILALAGSQNTVWQGMLLLALYSAGLGVPFLLAAAAIERFIYLLRRFRSYLRWIEIAAGVLLILLGITMLLGKMLMVAGWFS